MEHKDDSTTGISFSRIVSVFCVLFAFIFFSFPQLDAGITGTVSHGTEAPIEEDEKSSEEEVTVSSLAKRRVCNPRQKTTHPSKNGYKSQHAGLVFHRQQAISGHRLANGLRAPLVI